jgi:hypothetical protein
MVDEITDRTWVVIDALDGRAHYAELGRLREGEAPTRGMLAALAGDGPQDKPGSLPRLQVLSWIKLERLSQYDGPTWLDQAILGDFQVDAAMPGFAAELRQMLAARGRWLCDEGLAEVSASVGISPRPGMMAALRQRETARIAAALSRQLKACFVPAEAGRPIFGVYERALATPTAKLAVIRRQDTFTLAPWRPALEPLRGLNVSGFLGTHRVTWARDVGRGLPERS